jgi:Flp pilus assembly secretin CpaC
MRRTLRATFLAIAVVTIQCSAAWGNEQHLQVTVDQSQILRLPKPAAEIVLSNPSVVEVTAISDTMLVITGKSYGRINLIVSTSEGEVLIDTPVVVLDSGNPYLRVHRGNDKTTLSCTPRCEATLQIPDAAAQFAAIESQSSTKEKFRESSGSPFPCDSPGQIAGDGKRCGNRSAFSRDGGRRGRP